MSGLFCSLHDVAGRWSSDALHVNCAGSGSPKMRSRELPGNVSQPARLDVLQALASTNEVYQSGRPKASAVWARTASVVLPFHGCGFLQRHHLSAPSFGLVHNETTVVIASAEHAAYRWQRI